VRDTAYSSSWSPPSSRKPLRLATTLLKDEESAWDNHVLAGNFVSENFFNDWWIFGRLSSKPFLICLFTTPPHLKYVTTFPSNLSLIACFLILMFHEVVWQHMQGLVGLLITTLLQINLGKRLWLDRIMAKSLWPHFLSHSSRNKNRWTFHIFLTELSRAVLGPDF